jgi:hypothetical protein
LDHWRGFEERGVDERGNEGCGDEGGVIIDLRTVWKD